MEFIAALFFIRFFMDSISQNLFSKPFFDILVNRQLDNFFIHPQEENVNLTSGIKINIYTGSSFNSAKIINISIYEPEKIYQSIDHTKPTTIYIHGYHEHPSNKSIYSVIGAYLEQGTDNILLIDWSQLSEQFYWSVIPEMKDIALIITKTIDRLIELGLNLDTLHLVGHSLGAQMAGFIGKNSRYKLPRISGLDPAGPGFLLATDDHLDHQSAELVAILHTDRGFYGYERTTGTADFFPNGGSRIQPGCPIFSIPLDKSDLCHHFRAWEIWAESIKNPRAFASTLCLSYLQYLEGDCRNNEVVYFGPSLSKNAQGSYFFNTNFRSPFGKIN